MPIKSFTIENVAPIQFTNEAEVAGILSKEQSWGSAWGDFNGDGFPDLYVSNHYNQPYLFVNKQNGTFSEVSKSVWNWPLLNDKHGAAWADFDNDGDEDLLQMVGSQSGSGVGPKHLLVNSKGIFSDKAVELGVDYPVARGRTPLWFDYNNDGLLDLLMTSGDRVGTYPLALFKQSNAHFLNVNEQVKLSDTTGSYGSSFAILSDVLGNSQLDLLTNTIDTNFPLEFLIQTRFHLPITTLGSGIPNFSSVEDAAIADFNNDLLPDIFLARSSAVIVI